MPPGCLIILYRPINGLWSDIEPRYNVGAAVIVAQDSLRLKSHLCEEFS